MLNLFRVKYRKGWSMLGVFWSVFGDVIGNGVKARGCEGGGDSGRAEGIGEREVTWVE